MRTCSIKSRKGYEAVHLQELPQYVAIDIQEALEERFMESEAMYVRFCASC